MSVGPARIGALLCVLAVVGACRSGPPNVPPSIGFLKIATLGSPGGPGALRTEPTSVARDSLRHYVVALGLEDESTLLIFDSAGRILDSLGPHQAEPNASPGAHQTLRGRIATGTRGGTYWTVHAALSDSLELWDSTGHRIRTMRPSLSWYRPHPTGAHVSPTVPPSPRIVGIWRDASGRLWLVGMAANPHWERGLVRRRGGIVTDSIADPTDVYDLMIDEIDPDSGTVIAERRFSEFGSGLVIAPGLIGVTRRDADGWWYVDVYYVMSNEGHD